MPAKAKKKKAKKRKMPRKATSATHNKNGRFKVGNPGGPGNPYLSELASGRDVMAKARRSFDCDKVVKVLAAMYARAIDGHVAAARVFLEYTVGKPAQVVDATFHQEGSFGALRDDPVKLMAVIQAAQPEAKAGKGSGGADSD